LNPQIAQIQEIQPQRGTRSSKEEYSLLDMLSCFRFLFVFSEPFCGCYFLSV